MARITAKEAGNQNVVAFLDMLAFSEGTKGVGDDGYNVLVGGGLFTGYGAHPNKTVILKRKGKDDIPSTAAGRYQIRIATWRDVCKSMRRTLPYFGPEDQDRAAIALIKRRKAYSALMTGDLAEAVRLCRFEWASLPGNDYGQGGKTYTALMAAFVKAGGVVCEPSMRTRSQDLPK